MIYIDAEFKCHVTNDGTMTPVETDFFNGMSDEYIEGFRVIPEGHVWVREDGIEFVGEMIAPHTDYVELLGKQLMYEQKSRKEYEDLINELYSEVTA